MKRYDGIVNYTNGQSMLHGSIICVFIVVYLVERYKSQ